MIKITSISFCVILISVFGLKPNNILAQSFDAKLSEKVDKPRLARIMFYNCENLFDYIDDSLTIDEEFLPEGTRYWNKYKYYNKLNKIAKVITAVGGWSPPEIVGLCEVENKKVIYDLTHNSPLYLHEYSFLHKESPDRRGIDVALLYQAKSFTPIETQFLNVTFKHAPLKTTRDILYAKGLLHKTDTLHVFVNHWPSRWGGQMESEESRFSAATVLRTTVDSIYAVNSNANIIIMGDFNDEPTNKSVQEILDAKLDTLEKSNLYNLGVVAGVKKDEGTYKYQGVWGMLDQFIISETLLKESNSIYTTTNTFTIYNADFLLEKDENYLGTKPNRAFIGFRHNGGFSDHLPVFFDLYKKEN